MIRFLIAFITLLLCCDGFSQDSVTVVGERIVPVETSEEASEESDVLEELDALLESIDDEEDEGFQVAKEDILEKEFYETRDATTEELFEGIQEGLINMEQTETEEGGYAEAFESLVIDPVEGLGVSEDEIITLDKEGQLSGELNYSDRGVISRLRVDELEVAPPQKDEDVTSETFSQETVDYFTSDVTEIKATKVEVMDLSPLVRWQQRIMQNSRSVAAIVHRDRLSELTDSLYALEFRNTLGNQLDLCYNEPYRNQVSIGSGTAFLIDSNTLMTAAHVFESSLDEYVVIFRYEVITKSAAISPIVSKRNVYTIKEVVEENVALDVATFKIDRPASYRPLKLDQHNTIKFGDQVYMVGHPLGLPKKVALNARIIDDKPTDHFFTTLDAFQGNSGSPVFDLLTHKVIGVLVSGQKDFEWTGDCNKSTKCEPPYCEGEKVIRIQYFLDQ